MATSNQPKRNNDDWLAAWVLVLLLLGANAAQTLSLAQRKKARTLLRSKFNEDALRLAEGVTGGSIAVAQWQGLLALASGDYARQMAVAGAGTLPDAAVQEAIGVQVAEQLPFLDSFAALVATGALSVAAVAARSKMYGAVGWGAHWQAAEQSVVNADGMIVHYIARDDGRTCSPCFGAERNGPYRAGSNHPVPGSVCRGGGFCRCELRFETNPEIYARLAA